MVAITTMPVWAQSIPTPATQPHDFLPNVTYNQVAVEVGQPITLSFELEPGWELNAEAPSFMALFQQDKPLWQADKHALRQSNTQQMPGITRPVRLQGTFHYCRSDHQSQCLIKSIDYTLAPSNFSNNALTLRLLP